MICKNCQEKLIAKSKYCHGCGQKCNTARLTVKHFVMHDIVHGMFHLDRGLPHTLAQIFNRPGGVAQDYVYGKRKRYYNFFYLLLLILGLYLFLLPFGEAKGPLGPIVEDGELKFSVLFKLYRKGVIFSWIPILSIAAFIVFRRLKLSIIELAIPATISVIGANIFNLLLIIFRKLESRFLIDNILFDIFLTALYIGIFLFPLYSFAQFVKGNYSVMGKTWRLFAFYFLTLLLTLTGLFVLMYIVSNGQANSITFG